MRFDREEDVETNTNTIETDRDTNDSPRFGAVTKRRETAQQVTFECTDTDTSEQVGDECPNKRLGFEDPVSETDNQVVEREKSVGEHDTLARLHEGEENVVEKAEDEITEVEVTNSDAEEISLLLLIVGDVEFVLDGALKCDHGGVGHENRESREDGAFVQDVGTIVVLERSFGFIFSRRIGIGLFRILCGRRNQRTIFSIKIVISIFISVNTVVTRSIVVSFAVEVAIAAGEGATAVRFAERNTITFLFSSSFHAMVVH
jgi:hypothetical protein